MEKEKKRLGRPKIHDGELVGMAFRVGAETYKKFEQQRKEKNLSRALYLTYLVNTAK